MTVGDIAAINGEDLGKALGPRRADLVIEWLARTDLNLSQPVTKLSVKAVKGLGPATLRTLQALVDRTWYTQQR